MSYDIELKDPKTNEVIILDHPNDLKGGTYAVGGSQEAWLNVTYNYAKHFHEFVDKDKGIRALYGLTGKQAIPVLEKAIGKMNGKVSEDYWEPTEGNAKKALCDLLSLALMVPDGVFDGD